jgi:ATP-dependent DNA helicase DinG
VVFDEAHEIEDVASNYFGREISNYRFEELARDAEQAVRLSGQGGPNLLRRVTRVREHSREFFDGFPPREGRFAFELPARTSFLEQHRGSFDELASTLKSLESQIAALPVRVEELVAIARRAAELRGELSFLLESAEKNYVYWYERRGKGVFIAATPVEVSSLLRERVFEALDTVILTSATLAVGGKFDYVKQRLGIRGAKESVLPHEFDFAKQALLYVPPRIPDVRDASFADRAAEEITRILECTDGRAFCLFTSYSQMNQIFERVKPRTMFPLLIQGSAPRGALLDKFRNTEGAVLFATASFWQGIDVPGAQLSCVIVDRLPFAVPTDPVVAARVRAMQEDGRNAFAEYQVPESVLALKQGFGRLIRTRSDRGILAILDNRIVRMQYGRIFLESLPAYRITREIADVQRFMREGRDKN